MTIQKLNGSSSTEATPPKDYSSQNNAVQSHNQNGHKISFGRFVGELGKVAGTVKNFCIAQFSKLFNSTLEGKPGRSTIQAKNINTIDQMKQTLVGKFDGSSINVGRPPTIQAKSITTINQMTQTLVGKFDASAMTKESELPNDPIFKEDAINQQRSTAEEQKNITAYIQKYHTTEGYDRTKNYVSEERMGDASLLPPPSSHPLPRKQDPNIFGAPPPLPRKQDPSIFGIPPLPHGTAAEKLESVKEQRAIDSIQQEFSAPEMKGKYDRQVILDLGRGSTAEALCEKAKSQGLDSKAISLRTPNPDLTALDDLTLDSRLYIVGHGMPGATNISSDENVKKTIDDYVALLKNNPKLQDDGSGRHIKISVVACYGGADSIENKSFAEQLSKALFEAGIPAEVVGRKSYVSRWQGGQNQPFYKAVGDVWQEDGMKVSFITTESGTTAQNVKRANSSAYDQFKLPETLDPNSLQHGILSEHEENMLLHSPGQWLIKDMPTSLDYEDYRVNQKELVFRDRQGQLQRLNIPGNVDKAIIEHHLRKYQLPPYLGVQTQHPNE